MVPVRAGERILLLDVLRGFAMFGVLWSNLNESYSPATPDSNLQYGLEFAQIWIVEGRFYTLLGLLFGIGFATQLVRAEARGADTRGLFLRKMAILLGLAMVHGMLIWQGDVLTEYALTGATLVLFRKLPPRALLCWAAAMLLVAPYLINAAIVGFGVTFPKAPPVAQAAQIFTHGGVGQIIAETTRGYLYWYRRWLSLVFPPFLALFLLGLWIVRVDGLTWLMARRARLLWVMAISAGVWFVGLSSGSLVERIWHGSRSRMTLYDALLSARAWRPVAMQMLHRLGTWGSAGVYASGIALAATGPRGAHRTAWLAAVGRMSLTTYLTQSLVSVLLFYNYGLGWYGRVGYAGILGIAAVVFLAQMVASAWWLRRYRFGPAEWLWRSLAYWKRQPMRVGGGELPSARAAGLSS